MIIACLLQSGESVDVLASFCTQQAPMPILGLEQENYRDHSLCLFLFVLGYFDFSLMDLEHSLVSWVQPSESLLFIYFSTPRVEYSSP